MTLRPHALRILSSFTNENVAAWHEASLVPDEVDSYSNLVFSLNAGLLTPEFASGQPHRGHLIVHEDVPSDVRSRALSVFLITVRKIAEMKAGIFTNPFGAADFQGFKMHSERFRFGKGMVL